MKRFVIILAVCAVAISTAFAGRAQGATSMSAVGAGPHGYDWMVGTWSCTNAMSDRSSIGNLASTTLNVSKLKDGNVAIHTTSPNGDVTSYNAYNPNTKTWNSPFADSAGYYGTESTQQTGKTIVWTGTFYVKGAATPIRDTYTMLSMTKQLDVSEAKVNGAWKTTAKTTCTKS